MRHWLSFPSEPVLSVSRECAVGRGQESRKNQTDRLVYCFQQLTCLLLKYILKQAGRPLSLPFKGSQGSVCT